MGMRVRIEEIGRGLNPNETVVGVRTPDGMQRMVVSSRSIRDGTIDIGWPIRRQGRLLLIELPRETQSGAWRVWVDEGEIHDFEDARIRA